MSLGLSSLTSTMGVSRRWSLRSLPILNLYGLWNIYWVSNLLKTTKNIAQSCKEITLVGGIQSGAMGQSNIIWKTRQYGSTSDFTAERRGNHKCRLLLWKPRGGRGWGRVPKGKGDSEEGLGLREEDSPYLHFSLAPRTLAPKISSALRYLIWSFAHSCIHLSIHYIHKHISSACTSWTRENQFLPLWSLTKQWKEQTRHQNWRRSIMQSIQTGWNNSDCAASWFAEGWSEKASSRTWHLSWDWQVKKESVRIRSWGQRAPDRRNCQCKGSEVGINRDQERQCGGSEARDGRVIKDTSGEGGRVRM